MVKQWTLNPLTHICVETEGIFFEYTTSGITTFTIDQFGSLKELHSRTAFIQTLTVHHLTSEEVFDNAYKLCELPPMSLCNFIDPRKYICTDVLPLLLTSNMPPQNLTPFELFEVVQLSTELYRKETNE